MALDVYTSTGARLTSPQLPTYVTSLPSGPIDGQEIYYAADATNGVIWHLRYRSASSSSYKWEFVGGGPIETALDAEALSGSSITGGTWSDISTAVSVTCPLAGDYAVIGGSSIYVNTSACNALLGISKTGTDGVVSAYAQPTAINSWVHCNVAGVITGLSATNTISLRFRADLNNKIGRKASYIRITPVRVG